ncbi:hypothetical protein ADL03_00610 [Nocardia sp. NRRL S-836]|nr:hypothetical protein ADL03_00610 [Nocardia sp. NRRL S-836]
MPGAASEYDVRRPLTPTGTNLLGLVKHAAGVELNYFGRVFDRPFPDLRRRDHHRLTPRPPGMQQGNDNMPAVPSGWWTAHHANLEEIARRSWQGDAHVQ